MGIEEKEVGERKLFRKLLARERLKRLSEAAGSIVLSSEQRELQAVRSYLDEWRAFTRGYRMRTGYPSVCSWAAKCSEEIRTASEYLERSDKWAMEQVDKAVMEDLLKHPDGQAMRAAVLNRLLNVALPARVIRHGRLLAFTVAEVDQLADRGEKALVLILKTRNLPL